MGDATWVIPILHPSAVMRGRFADEPDQIRYLRRAKAISTGMATPPKLNSLLAGAYLDPTFPNQFAEWRERLSALADQRLAVDIECAGPHLVCVGFCPLDESLGPIVVPFRRAGGEPAYGHDETLWLVLFVHELLSNPAIPKWFHNGQAFDIPYLEWTGFEVNGFAGDTLLLQRFLYPDSPADLQHVAIHYAGFPAWKHLKNEEIPDDK